jgi:hypothetical protein
LAFGSLLAVEGRETGFDLTLGLDGVDYLNVSQEAALDCRKGYIPSHYIVLLVHVEILFPVADGFD